MPLDGGQLPMAAGYRLSADAAALTGAFAISALLAQPRPMLLRHLLTRAVSPELMPGRFHAASRAIIPQRSPSSARQAPILYSAKQRRVFHFYLVSTHFYLCLVSAYRCAARARCLRADAVGEQRYSLAVTFRSDISDATISDLPSGDEDYALMPQKRRERSASRREHAASIMA